MNRALYQFVFIVSWLLHFSFYFTFQEPLHVSGVKILQMPYIIMFHLFMLFWASDYRVNIKSSYHFFGILLGFSYFIFMSYIIVNTLVILSGAITIHRFIMGNNKGYWKNYRESEDDDDLYNNKMKLRYAEKMRKAEIKNRKKRKNINVVKMLSEKRKDLLEGDEFDGKE